MRLDFNRLKPPSLSLLSLSSAGIDSVGPFVAMLVTSINFSSLLVVLDTFLAVVLAQDVEGWYKAHPGMARISKVNQDTHQIIDQFNRTRFFHGTNVVMKESPWHRPLAWVPGVSSFGKQDVQNLHDMGLNIVRLGHSWAGAEPVRGSYNQTFIDIMKTQTKMAEEHGLYVLVDAHQDCLARQFCGHGVPDVSKDKGNLVPFILTRLCSGLLRKIGYQAAKCIHSPSSWRHSLWMKTAFHRRSRFAILLTGL